MNAITKGFPTKPDERLIYSVAIYAEGLVPSASVAAAMAGISERQFVDACEDPAIIRRVEAESLRWKLTGKTAELRAFAALDTLMEKLAAEVDSTDMPATTAVRIGEFLLRTSGLEQRRSATLRTDPYEKSIFTITTLHPGDPDPEPTDRPGLIIDLRGKQPEGK